MDGSESMDESESECDGEGKRGPRFLLLLTMGVHPLCSSATNLTPGTSSLNSSSTALQQVRSTLSSDVSSVGSLLSPVSSFNLGVCKVLEVIAFWESASIGMLPVSLLPDSASGLFYFFSLTVGPRLVMCLLDFLRWWHWWHLFLLLAILLFTPLLALKEGQNRLTDIAVSVFRTVHWASSTFILEHWSSKQVESGSPASWRVR